MPYIGNKKNGSEPILAIINGPCFEGMKYVEPFVGMGHILRRVINKSSYEAGDLRDSTYMIMKTLQRTKSFPNINRSVYSTLKDFSHDADLYFSLSLDEQKAFITQLDEICGHFPVEELVAFASQATPQSRPWDGYQGNKSELRSNGTNFDQNWKSQREADYHLLLNSETFRKTQIFHRSFDNWPLQSNTVLYCDGPYQSSTDANTRHYGTPAFDFDAYWDRLRQWSDPSLKNLVLVSEYKAPKDFKCILSFKKKGVHDRVNTERLFIHQDCYEFWRNCLPTALNYPPRRVKVLSSSESSDEGEPRRTRSSQKSVLRRSKRL